MAYPKSITSVHPIRGWKAAEMKCQSCGTSFVGWSGCHTHCKACPRSVRPGRKKPAVVRICASCGEHFAKARVSKFCPSCSGRNAPRATERSCIQCGKPFRPGWTRHEAKLCSRYCQGLWINANGLGPKHDTAELEIRLLAAIRSSSASLNNEEFYILTGVTSKVLKSRGWTVTSLFEKAGVARQRPKLGSRLEDRVFEVLRDLFPTAEIETQKCFDGWVGLKGGQLRVDFFIPSLKVIVEADGNQHFDSRGGQYPTDVIQKHDRIKDGLAARDGLTLIRVRQSNNKSVIRKKIVSLLPLQAAKPADKTS
jgi:hypothetical protein